MVSQNLVEQTASSSASQPQSFKSAMLAWFVSVWASLPLSVHAKWFLAVCLSVFPHIWVHLLSIIVRSFVVSVSSEVKSSASDVMSSMYSGVEGAAQHLDQQFVHTAAEVSASPPSVPLDSPAWLKYAVGFVGFLIGKKFSNP